MFAFAIHIDFMAVASKEGGTPSFLQSIASAARPNISAQADTPGEFMAFRVDGTGGAEGAQAPPHLFWIYVVKITKFPKFGKKILFSI